jgi:hypothetical protein
LPVRVVFVAMTMGAVWVNYEYCISICGRGNIMGVTKMRPRSGVMTALSYACKMWSAQSLSPFVDRVNPIGDVCLLCPPVSPVGFQSHHEEIFAEPEM